jgi:hypothetical protein
VYVTLVEDPPAEDGFPEEEENQAHEAGESDPIGEGRELHAERPTEERPGEERSARGSR